MKKTNPGAALAAALLLALVAVSCDRDRSNPLDPQSDFVQNRPETPAQLAAQPGVGVIRLGWQGGSDRDLAGYALFRSDRSNGTYAFVTGDGDSTAGITTGKTTFADSIRGENRTFFYRVAAIDTAGLQSELTTFVGATALEDNVSPEPPQSLSAVPDEDVLGRVVLRWSAPQTDSDGRELSGLSGFVVLRAEAGTGGAVPVDTLLAAIREFEDTGLRTLTTYSYSMVAFDEAGNTSRPAAAVQVTTPGLPTPEGVGAADEIGRVVVTWGAVDDENLVGYDVFRSTQSDDGFVRLEGAEGGSFTTGRTSYIDSNLTGGALFFYRIRAVGRDGAASELSSIVSAEAQSDEVPPGAPGNLSAVPDLSDFGHISVSWNVPQRDVDGGELTGLAGYHVFRSEETTDSFVRVATVNGPPFEDTGLEESNTYFYTVVAFDTEGNESGRATAVRVRTQGEDRVGPGAPQNVSAVADESATDRIVVRWGPPTVDSDGDELTGLAGFVVFRSEGGPGSFVPADTVAAGVRQWEDTGLKSLTLYAYTVVAFDEAGNESRSATSSQTQTGGIRAPQGLVAQDGIGRIEISWQPVDDSDLAGYSVYRSARSNEEYVRLEGAEGTDFTTGRSSYIDSNIASGSLFFYKVQAVATNGLLSERSAFVGGTSLADESAPGAPRNVSAVADENDAGQITVGWSAPAVDADGGDLTGLDGFVLLRAEDADGSLLPVDTLAAEVRTYVDTGLRALTTYRYAMVAFDGAGNQSSQALSSSTRTAGIPTPSGLRATDGLGRITLAWQSVDSDDLLGYEVHRAATSDGTYEILAGAESSSFTTGRTTYVDSNLTGGTLLFYRVRAVGTSGMTSELSTFVSGQAATGISTPTALSATDGLGRIALQWQAVDDDDLLGYDVYRSPRSDGPYEVLAGGEGSSFTTGRTTYVDSNLAGGTLLFYKVRAIGANGTTSELSTFVSAQAAADESAPGTPLNVSVIPSDTDPTQISVRWTAPVTDADGGTRTGLSGFRLLRAEGSESLVPVATLEADVRQYDDSDLKSLTAYRYALIAFDADGNESAQSSPGQATTIGMEIPSGVRASDGLGRITLEWQAVDSDDLLGYEVHRSTSSDGAYEVLSGSEGSSFTTGRTTYVDSNLAGGTLLFYKVRAVGANGITSELSSFVSGEAAADEAAPGAPQNVSVVPSDTDPTRITVRWTAPVTDSDGGMRTGLAGFRLLRAEGSGSLVPVATLEADVRQYDDSDLKSLTAYRYALIAFDADGNESAQSSPGQATTIGMEIPSGVRASDGLGRITLEWQAVDSDDLLGYEVHRSTSSDGAYEVLSGSEGSSFTTGRTTYVDSNLAGGTLLFYKVRAVGANGITSELSSFVSGEAAADEAAPGAPQNVSVIPSDTDPTQISVRWTAPVTDADGGTRTGLSGFRLLRAEGSESLVPVATLEADVRQYDDSDLKSLTAYRYALIAFDADGNESAQSSTGQATTIGVEVPSAVRATDGIGRIEISWNAVDDTELIGYNVYRSTRPDLDFVQLSGDGDDAFTTGRTSFIDSTVTSGDLFYYEITAVTASLQSERSAFVSGSAEADEIAPATPSDLVVIADDAEAMVTLSWSGSRADQDGGDLTGLASYVVFRSKDSASALAALDTIDASSTSYADTALQAATTYYYAVSAIDGSGNVSPRSSTSSVTTQGIGAPSNVAAAGDVTSITLSWTASDEEDLQGYNVYRSSRSDEGYSRLEGTEGAPFTTGQTSYIDSNLTGGQILFYRVSVVTDTGESEQSAFDGATVQTDTRAPAAPTFLDGDPVSDDPERLSLTWRAPGSDSDGSTLTGVSLYRIYRATTSDGDYEQIATSTTLSYDDSGLDQRTTYFYQVEALDDDGNISPRSSTAAVTTSGVDLPTNINLTASTPSDATEPPVVTISWTKSAGAIVRYEVERTTVANSTTDSDFTAIVPNNINTTRDDDGVSRDTTYYYRVRAVDGDARESDWTDLRSVKVKN